MDSLLLLNDMIEMKNGKMEKGKYEKNYLTLGEKKWMLFSSCLTIFKL